MNTNKFLITGASSVAPKPCQVYRALEDAVYQAKRLLSSASMPQDSIIVWAPYKIVRRKEVPIQVDDAPPITPDEPSDDSESLLPE